MAPVPTASEKRLCPNAINTPWAVRLEKSGLNRNEAAALASPTLQAYPARPSNSMNKAGIITFEAASIPLRTPLPTTAATETMTRVNQNSILPGDASTSSNKAAACPD